MRGKRAGLPPAYRNRSDQSTCAFQRYEHDASKTARSCDFPQLWHLGVFGISDLQYFAGLRDGEASLLERAWMGGAQRLVAGRTCRGDSSQMDDTVDKTIHGGRKAAD